MRSTLFSCFKKALTTSTIEVRSTTVEKILDTSIATGILHLTAEEYVFVAGGPEVENEPER